MVVVFGPDEWRLDDVQVGPRHDHLGVSTVNGRERRITSRSKGQLRLF